MIRWKLVTLIGALLGSTVLSATPAAANPNPTAYNSKSQYLGAYPVDSWPTACVNRRIYLAAGHYDWALFMANSVVVKRAGFYLGSGWYDWTDCLDPQNERYWHTSTLNPDNPAWETVSVSGGRLVTISGARAWGSYLDPQ